MFPVIYLMGNLFEPLSYLVLIGMMLYWIRGGRDHILIIAMLLILILGDSRSPGLFFMKNLRIVAILMLTFRAFSDIVSKKYRLDRVFYYSLPFFILAALSGLRSPIIGTAYAKMISYLFLIFVSFSFIPYHLQRRQGQLVLDIVYTSILVFGLGMLMIFLNPDQAIMGYRYRGMLGNPNGLGLYATVLFPILMIVRDYFPERKRTIQVAIILLIVSIILCQSRTALGTIGIFYLLYFFYKRGRWIVRSMWIFVVPSIVLFLSIVDLETIANAVGLAEYLRVESIVTGTGRFLAWSKSLEAITASPLLGRGFAYETHFFFELREYLIMTEHQGGVHNSYLAFLMNNGILGFLMFIIFLLAIFSRIKAHRYKMPFILAMVISTNFESWLNSSLNAFTIHFLIASVLLMGYENVKQSRLQL